MVTMFEYPNMNPLNNDCPELETLNWTGKVCFSLLMMKSILLLLLIGAIQVSTGSIIKSNFRDVLLSMGINPNKPLGVAFPKLVSLQNKDDIHLCCEPRVGYKGVNLFNSSFLEVVEEYFVSCAFDFWFIDLVSLIILVLY